MKIAILIGVSEYNKLNPLAACKNDLELMESLITNSNKFDKIFSISKNTNSININKILSELKNFRDEEVEEIFFYYTGHGYFNDNEFYYSCTDSDIEAIEQTFITNSNIDKLIRKLNPTVTIKLVDACNAGVRYVKNSKTSEVRLIEKYLQDSKGNFNSCYFMFSSDVDQNSIADDKLSHFTRSFFKSIKNHKYSKIKYGEIMNKIASDFESSKQTPIFVSQGNFNDVFCQITPEITQLLNKNENLSTSEDSKIELSNGKLDLNSSKSIEINQLIQKVQRKGDPLGECIAQALEISQKYNDTDLAEFCKIELIGSDEDKITKDERFKYRETEFICSTTEMNPDYMGWGGNITGMLSYMERDPQQYKKMKIFASFPISRIEEEEYEDQDNKLIVVKMPSDRILPDYNGPIKTLYCYAKANTYKKLAGTIRIKLTQKLVKLLENND